MSKKASIDTDDACNQRYLCEIIIALWCFVRNFPDGGLVAATAGNPSRLVDGVNTIGMLLTLAKVDTEASYPGISTEDEDRDPDYISLACLGTRQRFRCGGVLDDLIL
eukprot:Gb_05628 [translate_table: standard]